jgi:cytochrome c
MRYPSIPILFAACTASFAFAADPSAGQQVFQICSPCHATVAARNGVGPTLFGVVGRPSGSVAGFNYSRAMKDSHLTWTSPELDAYIADPQGIVPGNHMPYAGMHDPEQRAALLAYLETLK